MVLPGITSTAHWPQRPDPSLLPWIALDVPEPLLLSDIKKSYSEELLFGYMTMCRLSGDEEMECPVPLGSASL